MSRRAIFLLAATAALIATPAIADPECFGDSCRLPEVVDPPLAAATAPTHEDTAAESQASAKPPGKPAAQRAAPASKLAPSSARPQLVAEPAVRKPPVAAVAPESMPMPALREVDPALDEPAPKPRVYARAGYATSADSGALAGIPLATRPVVVGVPVVYGAYGVQPVYLVAPNAKIIHIDSND